MKFKHGTRRRALEYEKDWVQRWKEDTTFEKSVEKRPKDNSYVFYDGPPFISGNPHHGTLLSSIVKDAIPRYQTMKGKRVERVWGWDCHGLPAERFTEKKLGLKSREEVIDYGLEKYIIACRENMVQTSSEWNDVVARIGRWVDMDNAYKTMDKDYMESVWWAFKELYEKGKIYEGERVLMYCTLDATPLSKAEVTMDAGAYQDVTDPSVFVKFTLVEDDNYLTEAKDIYKKFAKIQYGHIDKDGKIHRATDPDFDDYFDTYRLQTTDQIVENQVGTCWDQTEYARVLFEKKDIPVTTYVIEYRDMASGDVYNHTILTFRSQGKYYWFEHAMPDITGIHEFGTLGELVAKLKEEFLSHSAQFLPKNYDVNDLRLWQYDAVKPGSAPDEVFAAWEQGADVTHYLKEGDNSITLDSSAKLLAWTTTPWTLPANTALAVNPALTYVEVEIDGEKLIVAKDLAAKVFVDEKHQPLSYKILREFSGKELVGKSYEPLLGVNRGKNAHKIWAADYVSSDDGTGIVHIAPAYGEEDFELARANKIPVVHTIDENGNFTESDWQGENVWAINKQIAKDLKEQGIVWKIDYIRHSYPHCHRCGTKLMYRAHPSWFMDIDGQRQKMLEDNGPINWFPPHVKNGRFAKTIEQAPDWNLSRDRFWATAMPVWKSESGKVKVVGSYAELKELSGVELEDYHRPWIDDVTFEIDGEKYTRIDKVMDCWFESGSMPFAQFHYPFENKEKFEANFPGDFIVEYIGQVRAWFYYVHAVNVALFGTHAFNNVIVTGNVAGNDGRKMSKSYGNYTDPNELMDKFSADSLRFLLLSSPLLNGEDFALQDKEVGDVARKLSMVWNMYDFFTMYAEVDGWEFDGELKDPLDECNNPLDIWIISRLHQLVAEVEKHMDGYNIPDALAPILPFLDDASNWYVRRSRRRFWKSEDDTDKNDAYRTLHYVLVRLSYVLAPFTPFLAEELYHNLTGDTESIHLKDWLPAGRVNELVTNDMETVRTYVNEGLSLRAKAGLKVRQPLASVAVPSMGKHVDFTPILMDELNVKAVVHGDNVAIDETLTPDLKREGLMREVIRHVQSARKTAGLQVDDRINLLLSTDDKELTKAITEHRETINKETLATTEAPTEAAFTTDVKVEGAPLSISLTKANT
jgi:isoleucyl-tRNA synthetase